MNFLGKIEKRFGAAQGTIFAVAAAFIVKGIGALYKIPLYNILGDYATGVYGMVFPLYALLLCVSCSGIPSAMTKMISDGYTPEKVVKKAFAVFLPICVFFSVALFLFAEKIATFQGNSDASSLYKSIAPSIFFVGCIAVFRGYFQGLSNMRVTALSQIFEQGVRAVIGLIGAYLLPISQLGKAIIAVSAITFSELFALVYCIIVYKKNGRKENIDTKEVSLKNLFSYVVPLTLSAVLIPLSGVAEGFIAMRSLKNLGDTGTAYYGLYVGATETIISLPAAVLYPVASGFLPKMNDENIASRCILISTVGSFVAAAFVFFFPNFIITVLFNGVAYKSVLQNMLKIASLNILLLPILQTTSVIMLSKGKQKRSFFNNAIGCVIKIAVCALLINNAEIHVFALTISDICCYFVALTLNLIYIIGIKRKRGSISNDYVGGAGNGKGRLVVKSV